MWGQLQNVWFGLSLGSVLLLAAVGLAITFGVMGVINMAHGELIMLGAYTTFVTQELIRTHAPGLFDWSLLIAAPAAFLVAGGIGVAIERGIVRFLYGRPLETLLATWGVSLILQQAVRTVFGPSNREVGNPSWMSGSFQFGEMLVTWNRFYIIIFALVVFAGLLTLLKRTPFGLQMRAVTQNRAMAAEMGIRTARVDALTFGLGAGIAGLAGVALSQIDNVSPNLGQSYIIDSFLVVVFGGAGNLWGTFAAAFSLGIANKFLEPCRGGGARQDPDPRLHHPLHPEAAARALPAAGPGGGGVSDDRAADRPAHRHLPRAALPRRGAGPGGEPAGGAGERRARAELHGGAARQVPLLRAAGGGARSLLGVRGDPEPRARGVLRAGRLCHGHAPDARDRRPGGLCQPGAARLHGVPELRASCPGSGTASTCSGSPA